MINKQRVKRIKNAIYTVIVVLFFLPLIMLIALCANMIGFLRDVSASLTQIESYMAGEAQPGGRNPESNSLAPSGQAYTPESRGAESSGTDEKEPDKEESSEESKKEPVPEPVSEVAESGLHSVRPNPYKPERFPELYFDTLCEPQDLSPDTLYLTIDNTPSTNFTDILDVLEKHGVEATFFVWWGDTGGAPSVGSDFRTIINAGHSIGIHSGMPYIPLSKLYSSADYFMSDFANIFIKIEQETGVKTRLYRLPGGSVSPGNPERQAVLEEVKDELDSRGFLQYDWNASAQDAVNPPLSMQQILNNLNTTIEKGDRIVALVHDGTSSDSTAKALDEFIPKCLAEGYSFKALDYGTVPVSFSPRD